MKASEVDEPMSKDDVEAALRLLLDVAIQANPIQTVANAVKQTHQDHNLTKGAIL